MTDMTYDHFQPFYPVNDIGPAAGRHPDQCKVLAETGANEVLKSCSTLIIGNINAVNP